MANLIKLSSSVIKLLKKTPAGRKIAREVSQAGNKISGKLHTKIKNFLERSRDTGPKDAPGVTYGGGTSRSAIIGRIPVRAYTKKRRLEGAGVGAGAGAGLGFVAGKSRKNKNNNSTAGKKKPSPPIAGHSETFSKLAGGKAGGKVSRKRGGTVSRKSGGKIMQGYKAGGKV